MSLFGNTNSTTTNPSSGFNFGDTPATTIGGGVTATPLFGTPTTSTPLFGTTAAAPSFGLGGTATSTAAAPSSGLTIGTPLSSKTTNFPATSTSLFGAAPSSTSATAAAPTSTGLTFGTPASTAPAASTPAFGLGGTSTAASTTVSTAPTSTGFTLSTPVSSAPKQNLTSMSTPLFGAGAPSTTSTAAAPAASTTLTLGGGGGTSTTGANATTTVSSAALQSMSFADFNGILTRLTDEFEGLHAQFIEDVQFLNDFDKVLRDNHVKIAAANEELSEIENDTSKCANESECISAQLKDISNLFSSLEKELGLIDLDEDLGNSTKNSDAKRQHIMQLYLATDAQMIQLEDDVESLNQQVYAIAKVTNPGQANTTETFDDIRQILGSQMEQFVYVDKQSEELNKKLNDIKI